MDKCVVLLLITSFSLCAHLCYHTGLLQVLKDSCQASSEHDDDDHLVEWVEGKVADM